MKTTPESSQSGSPLQKLRVIDAMLMVENAVSHLIVVERRSMRPIGVVSTLDVARALAGFP